MKKHNVNNRERERNGGRGKRERERERTGATQHAPDTRECKGEAEWRDDGGGRGRVVKRWVLQEAAWWRQSRARG